MRPVIFWPVLLVAGFLSLILGTLPIFLVLFGLDDVSWHTPMISKRDLSVGAGAMFIAWPDIKSIYEVRRTLAHAPELLPGGRSVVPYRAKIKLHGTNACGRVCSDGQLVALSRAKVITPKSDNAGFAAFLETHKEAWQGKIRSRMVDLGMPDSDILIYGEWCGPGINRGVAVCQLPKKIFAAFAARVLTPGKEDLYIVEPGILQVLLDDLPDVHVLPWVEDFQITIDFTKKPEELAGELEKVNALVAAVEATDPWVKSVFQIEGLGEGVVLYPMSPEGITIEGYGTLVWKAKGEKHQTVAHTKPAQPDPTVVQGSKAFADLVVTPARLEQGARAVANGELVFSPTTIGQFLRWMREDLEKETQGELLASGLDPKLAFQACVQKARTWYQDQLKQG